MTTMPFGKWRGRRLSEIDDNYLEWLLTIDLRAWLRQAVESELDERRDQARRDREWRTWEQREQDRQQTRETRGVDRAVAAEIVKAGYRQLAIKHHPDRGGDTRLMAKVNSAADWLVATVRGALGDGHDR